MPIPLGEGAAPEAKPGVPPVYRPPVNGGLFFGASMPLVKSKSKEAFKGNVKREIEAGKPPKQAVAIAYSVKRRAGSKRGR